MRGYTVAMILGRSPLSKALVLLAALAAAGFSLLRGPAPRRESRGDVLEAFRRGLGL